MVTQRGWKISVRIFVSQAHRSCQNQNPHYNQHAQLSLSPLFDAALLWATVRVPQSPAAAVLHFAKGIFIKNVWQRVHSCKISQHKLARVFAVWPALIWHPFGSPIVFLVSSARCSVPHGDVRSLVMRAILFICDYHFAADFALMLINEFLLRMYACAGFQNNLSL